MRALKVIKRYRKLFVMAQMSFFTIRMTIFLVLEFIYVLKIQVLMTSRNVMNKDREVFGKQNESIYKWMMLMGAHYRSLNATSILCYSIYVFLMLVYYISPTILPKYFTFIKTDELGPILLVQAPRLSKQVTFDRLDSILKRVMLSNLNFISSVKPHRASLQGTTISKASRRLSLLNQARNNTAFGLKKIAAESMMKNQREKTKQEATKLSYHQFHHLLYLSKNFDSVWPENRNEAWSKSLVSFNTLTFIVSFCFVYGGSQVASLVAQYLVQLSIQDDTNPTHKAMSQWNLMDRITLVEDSFVIWFISQRFIIPLTLLVMVVKDQSFSLEKLSLRFKVLFEKMKSINQVECSLAAKSGPFKELQRQCDIEALELYIMFQYFNLEQKNNLKLGNIIINQYVCFMSALTVTSLAVLSSIESKYFPLMVLLSIVIVGVTNCVLCLGAAINSDAMKAIRLAFGLLAHSQRVNNELEKLWFQRRTADRETNRTKLDESVYEAEKRLVSSSYLFNSLISPHTILLWQKMTQDYKHSTERHACSAFGVMNVDYKSILRFNFWVLSAVMVLVSNLFMKPPKSV